MESIYTKTARFDTARALSEDELRKMAPSIFATVAHESRSERFQPVPTIDILRALGKEGFSVVGARQSVARLAGKRDFTKHLLRIRRLDDGVKHQVGGTVFEMLLRNANDGTASYELMGALWRIACLNSLVAKIGEVDSVKIMHMGKSVPNDVIEGTYRVVKNAELALAAPADWSALRINGEMKMALAEAAHVLRFGDAEGNVKTPVKPAQLLEPRRRDDAANDLWTTFNVVQEHCIKGGDHGVGLNAAGQRLRQTTRPIKGIDQDVKLNKALWLLGEKMAAALKSAA